MHRRQPRGYTLAELVAVVAIIAVAAVVALPAAAPLAGFRTEVVVGDIVQALQLARDDAVRAGAYRVFACEPALRRVRVYGLQAKGPELVEATTMEPGNRVPFILPLDAALAGNNMPLASCSFVFADKKAGASVAFDELGNPVRGTGGPAERAQALTGGTIVLGSAGAQRSIVLDVTGRITTP